MWVFEKTLSSSELCGSVFISVWWEYTRHRLLHDHCTTAFKLRLRNCHSDEIGLLLLYTSPSLLIRYSVWINHFLMKASCLLQFWKKLWQTEIPLGQCYKFFLPFLCASISGGRGDPGILVCGQSFEWANLQGLRAWFFQHHPHLTPCCGGGMPGRTGG